MRRRDGLTDPQFNVSYISITNKIKLSYKDQQSDLSVFFSLQRSAIGLSQ